MSDCKELKNSGQSYINPLILTKNVIMAITKNVTFVRERPTLSNTEKGFSMLEILIVFLIIAILVVLALPQTIKSLQLYRLETSVNVISDKLWETRITAIKRNRTSWLRLDKTANTAQVRSTNDSGQTIDVGFPTKFSDGLVLDAPDSIEIGFNSMGQSTTGSQTITFKEEKSKKRKDITVSPAGKIIVGQMY